MSGVRSAKKSFTAEAEFEECEVGLVVHGLHLGGNLPAGVRLLQLNIGGVCHHLASDEDAVAVQKHPKAATGPGG